MLSRISLPMIYASFVLATASGLFLRLGLSSPAWIVCYGAMAMWLLCHWQESWAVCTRVWIVFVPPLYYCLSTSWSLAPMATLTSGLQLLMTTIIAVRIAASLTPETALKLLALVLSVLMALSLANGMLGFFSPAWEHNGAFLGMLTQKNAMGKVVVLTSLSLMALCWHWRWYWGMAAVYAGFAPVVLMTRSAGALMTYAVLAALFLLMSFTRFQPLMRARVLGLLIAAGVLILLAYMLTGGDPRADVLHLTGKSQTLTGRVDIWRLGLERWREDWLFGIGHRSFWVYDTYAVRKVHAEIESGLFWFHNIYIDILVAGGVAGAAICGAMLLTLLHRALWWYAASGSWDSAAWAMVLVISMIAGAADNVMFTPHGFNHLLIVMAYVFGQRCWIRARMRHRSYQRPMAPVSMAQFQ